MLRVEKLAGFVVNWRSFESFRIRAPLPMLDRMSINLSLAVRIIIIACCLVISIALVLVSLVVNAFVPLHCSFCNVYMLSLICNV